MPRLRQKRNCHIRKAIIVSREQSRSIRRLNIAINGVINGAINGVNGVINGAINGVINGVINGAINGVINGVVRAYELVMRGILEFRSMNDNYHYYY